MTSTSESIGILEEAQRREKEFAARLGIERAVLSAPMTGTAGAKLVAAVSAAGGLGVLPTGGMTAEESGSRQRKFGALRISPLPFRFEFPRKSRIVKRIFMSSPKAFRKY